MRVSSELGPSGDLARVKGAWSFASEAPQCIVIAPWCAAHLVGLLACLPLDVVLRRLRV